MKKKYWLGILLHLLLTNSCTVSNNVSKLIHVRLKQSLPFIREHKGELVNFVDSSDIIYYKNYTICITPVKELFKFSKDSIGERADPSYFIFSNKSINGYMFYNINDTNFEMKNVDTFFREKYLTNIDFCAKSNDTLIEIKKEDKSNSILKRYITKKKYDETYPDSSIYIFTKNFPKIDYSISPKMDTIDKVKLSRIKFVYNPQKSMKYEFILPARELWIELKVVEPTDEKEILNFVRRFKNNNSIK